jgi:riboflavin transporter FmnP
MRMKQRLKTILLNQLVGAIAIGYLIARGIEAFIGAFMPAFNALLTQWLTGTNLKYDSRDMVRASMISNLVLTSLYLLIAYVFALWLYAKPVEGTDSEATPD